MPGGRTGAEGVPRGRTGRISPCGRRTRPWPRGRGHLSGPVSALFLQNWRELRVGDGFAPLGSLGHLGDCCAHGGLQCSSWGCCDSPSVAPALPRVSHVDRVQLWAQFHPGLAQCQGPHFSGVFEGGGPSPSPPGQLFGCIKQQGSGGLPLFPLPHPHPARGSETRPGPQICGPRGVRRPRPHHR